MKTENNDFFLNKGGNLDFFPASANLDYILGLTSSLCPVIFFFRKLCFCTCNVFSSSPKFSSLHYTTEPRHAGIGQTPGVQKMGEWKEIFISFFIMEYQ